MSIELRVQGAPTVILQPPGKVGPQGETGPAGVSVTSASINAQGRLILALSNGSNIDAGPAKGADGLPGAPGVNGVSVTGASQDAQGHLILTLSSGQTVDAGNVRGAAGVGVTGASTAGGVLTLTLSDGQTVNAGPLPQGPKGDTGAQGPAGPAGAASTVPGPPGPAGTNGRGVQSVAVTNGRLIVTYTDGGTQDAGALPSGEPGSGTPGADGVSVTNAQINGSGHLIITLSTGATIDAGLAKGADGTDGEDGLPGAPGAAATVAVGTVTTGAAGSQAAVTNSGTSSAAVLNFTIPKGGDGPTGPAGPGVPTGGTAGQVLQKKTGTDFDTEWATPASGGAASSPDPATRFLVAPKSPELFTYPTGINEFDLARDGTRVLIAYDNKTQTIIKAAASVEALANAPQLAAIPMRYPALVKSGSTWNAFGYVAGTGVVRSTATAPEGPWSAPAAVTGFGAYADPHLTPLPDGTWLMAVKSITSPYPSRIFTAATLAGPWTLASTPLNGQTTQTWYAQEQADPAVAWLDGQPVLLFAGWNGSEQVLGSAPLNPTTWQATGPATRILRPTEAWQQRNGMNKIFNPVLFEGRVYYSHNVSTGGAEGPAVAAGWGYLALNEADARLMALEARVPSSPVSAAGDTYGVLPATPKTRRMLAYAESSHIFTYAYGFLNTGNAEVSSAAATVWAADPQDTPDWVDLYLPPCVVMGDSIAEGNPAYEGRLSDATTPAAATTNPLGTLAGDLGRLTGMYWYNHGIGSQTTVQLLARFNRDVLGQSVAVGDGRGDVTLPAPAIAAVIVGGLNDIFTGVSANITQANLLEMADRCVANGLIAVFLTLPTHNTATAAQAQAITDLNAWMKVALPPRGVQVHDWTAWFSANPALRVDAVHPSTAGYTALAERVAGGATLPRWAGIQLLTNVSPTNPPAGLVWATNTTLTVGSSVTTHAVKLAPGATDILAASPGTSPKVRVQFNSYDMSTYAEYGVAALGRVSVKTTA